MESPADSPFQGFPPLTDKVLQAALELRESLLASTHSLASSKHFDPNSVVAGTPVLHRLHKLAVSLWFNRRTKIKTPRDACPVVRFFLLSCRQPDGTYLDPEQITSNAAKLLWGARATAWTVAVRSEYPSGDLGVPPSGRVDEFQHFERVLLPFLSRDLPTPFATVDGLASVVHHLSKWHRSLPRVRYTLLKPGLSSVLVDDLPLSIPLLRSGTLRLQSVCFNLLVKIFCGWDPASWALKVQASCRLAGAAVEGFERCSLKDRFNDTSLGYSFASEPANAHLWVEANGALEKAARDSYFHEVSAEGVSEGTVPPQTLALLVTGPQTHVN